MRTFLKLSILTCSFSFFIQFEAQAQEWTNKEEKLENSSFDQLVESFDAFWEGKAMEKGKGYKPFKRWEKKWENRLDEEGQIPAAGRSLEQFNKFLRRNPNNNKSIMTAWSSLGPNSTTGGYAGTGRINSVAFDPNNSNVLYVGSAGGGLWKSTDGGNNWTAKTDFLGSIGISAIIVDPLNTNIIYIGTGDGDASDNYSIGVLKSIDGGDTWNTTGLNWSTSNTRLIRAMVIDPNDNNTLIAATSNGIYRTTNAGTSWTNEESGSFYDIKINHLASSNTFYACTRYDVFRSTDNGNNWNSTFNLTGTRRLALATTPANTNYVYVLAAGNDNGFSALYRSTDSGSNFSSRSTSPNLLGWNTNGGDSGGQGWYDLAFCASPANANTIHVGGVNHWKSTNGGSSWTIKSHWSGSGGIFEVHADKHILAYQNNSTLWEGNDGGIYKTTNGGDTWTDLTSNLVISQMYRIGVSEVDNRLIAGLQDNGTKARNTVNNWVDELGGDGMDCAINPTNGSVMYGASQRGNIRRSTNGGSSWTDIQANIPGNPTGAWVTPYRLDPNTPTTIYAGFRDLWKSTNQGSSWTSIASDPVGSNLTRLAIAPSNSNYIYTGISSELHRTTNGGTSWTQVNMPGNSTAMIKVSPNDPMKVYAVRQTFNNNSQVYVSTDGAATWTSITDNLPAIPANCIAIHDDGQETIYVGMDVGVYWKNNSVTSWQLYNTALPNVNVSEIEIKETTNEIFLATFGRGVWSNSTINNSNICLSPSNIEITNLSDVDVSMQWSDIDVALGVGYEWANTNSEIPPNSGTKTPSKTVSISGLNNGNSYYFHIRSECSTDDFSPWATFGPYQTADAVCGDDVYDSGGVNGEYGNNESTTTLICPSNGQNTVTITFNAFNVETNWDALYIYDGIGTEGSLFSSGNGQTNGNFPAGGYWGTTAPGPFTSTSSDGCLTLQFLSDGSVTRSGWDVDVSCNSPCSSDVSNLNDNGPGSLRFAAACTDGNATLNVFPSLIGDTVVLTSTLEIQTAIGLMPSSSPTFFVRANGNFTALHLMPGAELEADGMTLIGADNSTLPVVINEGLLHLHFVDIKKGQNSSDAQTIRNESSGVLIIEEEINIKE